MSDANEKLKPNKGDTAHAFVKASLSTIPVIGGPAAELFSALVTPPLAQRRDRWIERIAETVEDLRKTSGTTLESLSRNEQFISTLLHATQVALRSHHEEKLKALRNAVTNAALPDSPDDVTQQVFLTQVDDLTPSHLKILAYFHNPVDWAAKQNFSLPNRPVPNTEQYAFVSLFPEFVDQRYLFKQLCRDLEVRGLVRPQESRKVAEKSYTTRMGKSFLKFISNPFAEE